MSVSLDGFVAGPDQSRENPLGIGGLELHHWHLDEPLHEADARAQNELMRRRGAYVMGRNMFGPIRGPWDGEWRGWWGDEPPYHAPVFVLTHYPHEPIEMNGGTTFHLVTGGFDAALERTRAAGDGLGVDIVGGASTVRQALAAAVIDELLLDIVPVLVGTGDRCSTGWTTPANRSRSCMPRTRRTCAIASAADSTDTQADLSGDLHQSHRVPLRRGSLP